MLWQQIIRKEGMQVPTNIKAATQQIKEVLGDIILQAEEGNHPPLETYILIREVALLINGDKKAKGILDQVRDLAISEAEQYNGQEFMGYKIQVKTSGRWDYSSCSQVTELKEELADLSKDLKDRIKDAEQLAQSLSRNASAGMVDEDTGQVMEPARFIPNATSITLTKSK